MISSFDQVAKDYDKAFVHSAIGSLQRDIVWRYLTKIIHSNSGMKVLELNCGTGEDAVWLAKNGCRVTATDVSEEMLKIASKKATESELENEISFATLDISNPEGFKLETKYDLVFSNFGGLNCLDKIELLTLFHWIQKALKPGGRFVSVLMPTYCFWDSIYMLAKGKHTQIFRRKRKGPLKVPVGNGFVNTWYYSPAAIHKLSKQHFRKIKTVPVGLFIPPSYFEGLFCRGMQKCSTGLAKLDRLI